MSKKTIKDAAKRSRKPTKSRKSAISRTRPKARASSRSARTGAATATPDRKRARRAVGQYGLMVDERNAADNYETSREAIDMLLSHVKLEGGVIDPSCGRGNIVLFLMASHAAVGAVVGVDKHHYKPVHENIAKHLKFGRDFLDTDMLSADYKNFVMNPPFADSDKHVRHALRMLPSDGKLCVLLRMTWIAAKKRKDLLDHLAKIVVCGRLKMLPPDVPDKGHNGAVDFAWFVFEPRMVEATKIVRA